MAVLICEKARTLVTINPGEHKPGVSISLEEHAAILIWNNNNNNNTVNTQFFIIAKLK